MPRTYRRKKKNVYDPQRVADAIKAVQNGESIREAERTYGVPKSTLSDTLKKKYRSPGKPGRTQLIPKDIENKIATALSEAARQGMGISRRQLLRRVGELSKKIKVTFKNGTPGKDWFYGFRKRHPELTIRKPEKLTTTRARMSNPEILGKYFDDLKCLLDNLDITNNPAVIWNCDETGKQFEHDPVKVLAPKGARSVVGRTTSNRTNVTVMACVNAAGISMPPMFIVKGKTSKSLHGFNTEQSPMGSMWGFQDKGWMTDALGEIWFRDIFLKHCGSARPQMLILDGHSSHETLAILEMAIQENIHILSLPPHTTHALQPLDRTVFGPLNTAYNTVCSDYLGQDPLNAVNKWTFPGIFRKAWDLALTVSNITAGFRACGIFPFDPSAVPSEMTSPSCPTDVPLTPTGNDTNPPEPTSHAVTPRPPRENCSVDDANSEPRTIEDPSLLLDLISSGQCEIFSPDSSGVAAIPSTLDTSTDDAWSEEINALFIPPKVTSSVQNVTPSARSKRTGHRLLTSAEVVEEKRLVAIRKQEKEDKKLERASKSKIKTK